MIDPDVERRYADCVELMDAWKHFLDLVNRATKAKEQLTQQIEEQFLNAKARIAMLHDSFMEALKHDRSTGQAMIELVNRSISLRYLQRANEAEHKKVEIEWHEVFLLLNETVSSLNEERARLANVNQFTHNLARMRDRLAANFKSFLRSIWLKLGIAAAVSSFVIWGVPAMGIYDYDNLQDDLPFLRPAIGGFYNVSRDLLGFESPYLDMGTFREKLMEARDPNYSLRVLTSEIDRDEFENSSFPRLFNRQTSSERQDLLELLKKADHYETIQMENRSGVRQGLMYVYWFRRMPDARAVPLHFESMSNLNKRVTDLMRKSNVVIILSSEEERHMNAMREGFMDKMGPK